jgi:hypothetical protein
MSTYIDVTTFWVHVIPYYVPNIHSRLNMKHKNGNVGCLGSHDARIMHSTDT